MGQRLVVHNGNNSIFISAKEVEKLLTKDKKADHAAVSFVVPETLGTCRVHPVRNDDLLSWLQAGGLR